MAYSDLAPNQYITFGNANTCGFPILHPLPLSTQGQQFMTKDDVLYYLNVAATNLNVLTSGSQWPWKALLSSGRTTSWRGITPFCVQTVEVRPTGLSNFVIYHALNIISTSVHTDFRGSLALATQSSQYFWSHTGDTNMDGMVHQLISVIVGARVYYSTGDSLALLADGYYLKCDYPDVVYHLVNSIIVGIINI